MGWTIDMNGTFINIESLNLYNATTFGEETDKRQIIKLLIFELCAKANPTYNSVGILRTPPPEQTIGSAPIRKKPSSLVSHIYIVRYPKQTLTGSKLDLYH